MSETNTVERPVMPITVRVTYASKPKPKAGERRRTNKHGLQIRVQAMATNWNGEPIGRVVRAGRPVFDWCKPSDLQPWDRHWLTGEEMDKYFPVDQYPAGYMQQRGAA